MGVAPKYFTMAKFRDFIETNVNTKTLSSDGTDPNPTQTIDSAKDLVANIGDDPHYSDDFAKISAMAPGMNRRNAIMDLSANAVKSNTSGSSRATPLDVSKFLTMQLNKIPKPGGSTAGQFSKFMKKMRKGMKK